MQGEVTCIDRDPEAVVLANSILSYITDFDGTKYAIIAEAVSFQCYDEYNTIILTLEAGTSLLEKLEILQVIHNGIMPETTVIVRSSKTDMFCNAESAIDTKRWVIHDRFDIFDGLSESFILFKK